MVARMGQVAGRSCYAMRRRGKECFAKSLLVSQGVENGAGEWLIGCTALKGPAMASDSSVELRHPQMLSPTAPATAEGDSRLAVLAHRIQLQCGAELELFRSRLYALTALDIGTGGLDAAATAMAQRPSLTSQDVSVDVVGYMGARPIGGRTNVGISVAMNLHASGSASPVPWEEAHAWAGAVADGPWIAAEFVGSREIPHGMVFHYALTDSQYSLTDENSALADALAAYSWIELPDDL